VVVTGAAGFLGSHVVEAFAHAGHEVLAVDALHRSATPEAARANWVPLTGHPGITPVEADLVTDDLTTLAEADVVVHLAGRPGVRDSWRARADAVRDNVDASRRLLANCLARPPGRRPRVVVASSSSVYGSAGARPHRESDPPRPGSPYAQTKLAVERLAVEAATGGLPTVVLRYFSLYGSRQRPDMAFHRFCEAALDGRPLPVFGDGGQSRAFTHVSDAVAATLAAATTAGPSGTADPAAGASDLLSGAPINVGHPEPTSVHAAVGLLAGLLGRPLETDHRPTVAGDVVRTWAATGRARRLLGWSAQVGLADGLAEQVAWHRGRRRG
jgi:nucleoside-diphosphate-sugar epimerase